MWWGGVGLGVEEGWEGQTYDLGLFFKSLMMSVHLSNVF